MQRYANVGGEKHLPFSKGRGLCPCCGGLLIAKCGQINAHHWAHESRDDCDSWSEPIGPWHIWWQNLVRPEFLEVTKGPHRADVVGNGGVIIELQHSSISAEDIVARETHYGNMVWLFDATHRFTYMKSGKRAFFSFGQTKHLDLCKKPVFLDFGFDVVQVECFTDAINMVSGFGLVRSREWIADAFLANVREPRGNAGGRFIPELGGSDPWTRKSPVWKVKHPTIWTDPSTGQSVTYPKWTEYIWLQYGTRTGADRRDTLWDYEKVINRYPDIANGWSRDELLQMMDFFCGQAVILGGLLRVLPHAAFVTQAKGRVSATEHFLRMAEGHIQAGQVPVLKSSTKERLLEKAREGELSQYGRLLRLAGGAAERSLFD